MASEEQKAANRKLVEKNLFLAQGAAPQQAETDGFQCGKCKQRRTMYVSYFPLFRAVEGMRGLMIIIYFCFLILFRYYQVRRFSALGSI